MATNIGTKGYVEFIFTFCGRFHGVMFGTEIDLQFGVIVILFQHFQLRYAVA
jgi:hypothetical protein